VAARRKLLLRQSVFNALLNHLVPLPPRRFVVFGVALHLRFAQSASLQLTRFIGASISSGGPRSECQSKYEHRAYKPRHLFCSFDDSPLQPHCGAHRSGSAVKLVWQHDTYKSAPRSCLLIGRNGAIRAKADVALTSSIDPSRQFQTRYYGAMP
jgi:hypothetical protein